MSLKNKIVRVMIPLSFSLTLVGCASTVENIINATENIDTFTSEITTEFNSIKDLESEVQASFEDSLQNDAELESFANESAPVFENIDLRQESLDAIKASTEDLEKVQKNLADFDDDQFDGETINDMITNLNSTLQVLNSYNENYQTYLDTQKEYFNALGQDDPTYETFIEGIEQMGDLDQQLIEIENDLNNQLADLQASAKQARDKAIELQQQEEGEN